MAVGATSNDMGLFSKVKLSIDEETGTMKGASDAFSDAIDQMYQAAKSSAVKKETEIKQINEKLEALSTLQSKVTELGNKSKFLFHSDAWGNSGVFSNLYANYSSSSVTPVTDLLDLNIAATANLQEFTLEIEQVASYDMSTATTGVADTSSDLNWSGTLTINNQDISITNNMSLTDVKNIINSYKDATNVKANIIKVAEDDYRLSFQSIDMATPMIISDTLIGNPGGTLPDETGKTVDQLSAKIRFNGISMTRSSNNIDDIVDGLTVVLKKAEDGTTMTIRLSPDETSVKEAIHDWVDALNTVINEVEKHKSYDLDKQTLNKDAILYNTNIIQSVDALVKSNLSWVVTGVNANEFKILDQIGIKLNTSTGKYYIDDQALDISVKNNFEGVRKVFEYQNEISNGNYIVSTHPKSVPGNIIADNSGAQLTTTVTLNKDGGGNITADITISGGDYAAHTFSVPSDKITVRGEVIEFLGDDAVSGTSTELPYKGFTFVYVGASGIANGSYDSTTLKITQGYGDRFAANISSLLVDDKGTFANQKVTFTDKIKSLEKAMEQITIKANKERTKYEHQFARLEAVRQALAPLQSIVEAFSKMMTNK